MEESTKEVIVDAREMLANATGPLEYGLTNDYLFKAFLQKNQRVLRALVASLLHMGEEEIVDITVKNPIIIGDAVEDKMYILDMLLELNGNRIINLEMQVANQEFWADRALAYSARLFDNVKSGREYATVKPVYHIGILDFTLFEGLNEFYGTYVMMNERNHHVFSRKLAISVLDLNQIENATEEDKAYQIDYWARLFKASTWEKLKILAEKSEVMKDCVVTICELTADERARMQMEAREEHNRVIRTYEHIIQNLETENAEMSAEIERLKALLEQTKKLALDRTPGQVMVVLGVTQEELDIALM